MIKDEDEEVAKIDMEEWESLVELSSYPTLVMFYSPNCPPCLAMEPNFSSNAKEFGGKVTCVRVNIIDNPIIAV